jgi:plasmid stabilization system protein ParE
MARIEVAPEVADDLDRIVEHLLQHDAADALSRVEDIVRAVDVLEHNPLIGRPGRAGLRELVIGRRSRGYVALYRYVAELDTVFLLAIRSQKEAGYLRFREP